jgi:hypothetical protein
MLIRIVPGLVLVLLIVVPAHVKDIHILFVQEM